MIKILTVYAYSVCVSQSKHEAMVPHPAFPYVKYHPSTECHPVQLIPGPWAKVTTSAVMGDAHPKALDGHDTGMMIPHIPATPPELTNMLLPLTLLGSSCRFPFASFKVHAEDKGVCGFFPLLAPFQYCDTPEQSDEGKKDKKGKDGKGGGKAQGNKPKGKEDRGRAKATREGPADPDNNREGSLVQKTPGQWLREKNPFKSPAEELAAFLSGMKAGKGLLYLPTAKTVFMSFSLAELLAGWAKIAVFTAVDQIAGRVFSMVNPISPRVGERFDNDALREWSAKLARRGWGQIEQQVARQMAGEAAKEAAGYAGKKLAKGLVDGTAKSFIMDGKFKAPYGLFSYSPSKGGGTFLKWGEFDSAPTPIKWPGIKGKMGEAYKDMTDIPGVAELTKDAPRLSGPTAP